MQQGPLPFERGTYQSAPGLEGQEFYDVRYNQWIKIVKNTDAATLARRQGVKWEDASAFTVDLTTAAAQGRMFAGVVDPLIPSGGAVPINGHCYIVTKGIVTVAVGTGSAVFVAGYGVMLSADTDKGKFDLADITAAGAVGLLTTELGNLANMVGVAMLSANINTATEILL
ncbi:MAG: hypothetical protein ACYTBJ_01880 [Planctomycetota bacterium]|jgi:hypothetical protein